jgi:transcription elongation factor GreB
MSRAFVKEDVDIPERAGRRRSASGLPPGAMNYMTARGAGRFRAEAAERRSRGDLDGAAQLETILASATIVEPSDAVADTVTFGATVSVKTDAGGLETYRIVGVDEVGHEPGAISWVSSIGRALLGAELGDKVSIAEGTPKVTVVKIEQI